MAGRWQILAALTAARVGMGFQFQAIACAAPFLAPDLGLELETHADARRGERGEDLPATCHAVPPS